MVRTGRHAKGPGKGHGMKTIGRVGIVAGTLLSLLLAAGCSDDEQVSVSASMSSDKKTLEFRFANGVTMKLIRIEAGTFRMGSPETEKDRERSEGPQRQVTISKPFYMGVTEVTQAQWKAVMGTQPWDGERWTKAGGDYAASWISWDDATAFCKALSKKTGSTVRLPTEAEWEYACRAGTTTTYSFGEESMASYFGDDSWKLGDYAWYTDNTQNKGKEYAHPVGVKMPNAWGLYDMHGNVYEYCADWYGEEYYANADTRDPKGPSSGSGNRRVLRGGSWSNGPWYCRSANRGGGTPGRRGSNVGLRVVSDAGPTGA